jgi:hypothetical protein
MVAGVRGRDPGDRGPEEMGVESGVGHGASGRALGSGRTRPGGSRPRTDSQPGGLRARERVRQQAQPLARSPRSGPRIDSRRWLALSSGWHRRAGRCRERGTGLSDLGLLPRVCEYTLHQRIQALALLGDASSADGQRRPGVLAIRGRNRPILPARECRPTRRASQDEPPPPLPRRGEDARTRAVGGDAHEGPQPEPSEAYRVGARQAPPPVSLARPRGALVLRVFG